MALDATLAPSEPARRISLGAWLRWGACAIAVGVLAKTLAGADLRLAAALIERAGPRVLAIFAPCTLAIALDAAACRVLFSALGRAPRYLSVLAARFSGEAVAMSLPAGGVVVESLNPMLLNRRCGLPYQTAIAGMAAKKWLVMRAHAAYIALSVAVGYSFLADRSRAIVGAPGLAWIVLGSALVPLALSIGMQASLVRGSIAGRLVGALARLPSARLRAWLSSRERAFRDTDAGFAKVAAARGACAKALAIFVATWLLESAETLVILRVLGAPVGFAEVLSFEAGLSLLRSLAFFSPGGLGVQDLGYLAFLGSLGIPDATAVAAAFVLLKRSKEIVYVAAGYAVLWVTGRGRAALDLGAREAAPSA